MRPLTALTISGLFFCLAGPFMTTNAFAKTVRLAALGDSLTEGWMLSPTDAFPSVLERLLRELGHDVEILNFGVSGDTTSGGLSRLGPVLAANPDGVILELGTNDGLMGFNPAAIEENLETIIAACRARNIPVLLAGMRGLPGMGRAYATQFSTLFERLAVRHNLLFFPFFLGGVVGQRGLCFPDGLHPNALGVQTITENFLPTAVAFLNEIQTKHANENNR